MKFNHTILSAIILAIPYSGSSAELMPVDSLALRVTCGTSASRINFVSDTTYTDKDYYRIYPNRDNTVTIAGNSPVSQAVGLNRYLRDVAGIHICWNNPTQALPYPLPLPADTLSGSTDLPIRYYLNYCTFSYSMPFWDEHRWMQEIDWMALHGINTPLAIVGTEAVWRNVLLRLGFSTEDARTFIAGPPYIAWWLMNNLEGWGGPVTDEWILRQQSLQIKILNRMRSLGMHPVLPGYSGMLPHDASDRLGTDTSDPGLWCGFTRPAFLTPDSHLFNKIADIYYEELTDLYGKADYYSMDPFHEGGNTTGVDLTKAGRQILDAMHRTNPNAVWIIQAWQENPKNVMIDSLPPGSLLVLDLYAETKPQWGDRDSQWYRSEGFGHHNWAYCMLLNFGGNTGLHGRINKLISGFNKANATSTTLRGIGSTAEGIENNPVMYEILFDLPWDTNPKRSESIDTYIQYRYGLDRLIPELTEAWRILMNTVYNAPADYPGEGTVESIICARPAWGLKSASTWGNATLFYDPDSTIRAAALYKQVATPTLMKSNNFRYDLADICRQALCDKAYRLYKLIQEQHAAGKILQARQNANVFLQTIMQVDSLLADVPGFSTKKWLEEAAHAASIPDMRKHFVRNAARLITVWGDSAAANQYGLRDYSHRLWNGITGELYYNRWKVFFYKELANKPDSLPAPDFYRMELQWIENKVKEFE